MKSSLPSPSRSQLTLAEGLRLHQSGDLAGAEGIYQSVLSAEPNNPDALHLLGMLAGQRGDGARAVDLIALAAKIRPGDADIQHNLGFALSAMGRFDQAIAAFRQAIELKPPFAEAWRNLGIALERQGKLGEAVGAFKRAISIQPHFAEAYANLGNALLTADCIDETISACREAIVLRPNMAEAHMNLATALRRKGNFDEAITECRKTVELRPDLARAFGNYANIVAELGRFDEAASLYKKAMALQPDYPLAHSNLLFLMQYQPGKGAADILEEARRWNQKHGEPLRTFHRPHANNRDPSRRLRIGYVSPDFRAHCQALFTWPLLSNHDHRQFEIYCYASVPRPDGYTARLQPQADVWRFVFDRSDAALAEIIRQDQIDILVDLTMHMGNGRPLLFARKAAPVQIAWLAYPGTTGMDAMDYRLSDPYLDPPGTQDANYVEQTVRLGDTFWCYDPLTNEPEVNELPALRRGYITFGCQNNFCKVNDHTLALWGEVLASVADSKLVLMAPEGQTRARTLEKFAALGIQKERIEFVAFRPRAEYLKDYHRIDIGLDTIPYNGHTTSLDSYWMGVPVITLVGETVVGRAGLSQLSNLGLKELVAQSSREFGEIAARLAQDLPRLTELRRTLRSRMKASPLMDAPRFARNIESAYRSVWQNWCSQRTIGS